MKKNNSRFAEIDILAPEKNVKIESVTTKIQNEIPATPPKKPVITFKSYEIVVNTLLNVRSGPSYEQKIVGVLPSGTKKEILEEKEGWGRIEADQWICLEYTYKI